MQPGRTLSDVALALMQYPRAAFCLHFTDLEGDEGLVMDKLCVPMNKGAEAAGLDSVYHWQGAALYLYFNGIAYCRNVWQLDVMNAV